MKKYLVIGNPVEHSLSPKLHNYWIKENNIDAIYEKKQLEVNEIKKIIDEIKNNKINGVNVTLPHKKSVIPFLDELTSVAKHTESVNTIYKKNDKLIGDNTDVGGFELSLKNINFNVQKKNIFLLGAGGVTPSIILALKQMKASKIFLSNRTKTKAENLKNKFPFIEIVNWGDLKKFDIIINTTSVGLKKNDEIISTHRSHAHYIGKGGNLKSMISELYGKGSGCAKGLGGSMHLQDLSSGIFGSVPRFSVEFQMFGRGGYQTQPKT